MTSNHATSADGAFRYKIGHKLYCEILDDYHDEPVPCINQDCRACTIAMGYVAGTQIGREIP